MLALVTVAGCTATRATSPAQSVASDAGPQVSEPAAPPESLEAGELAPGPGQAKVAAACSGCHAISQITSKAYSEAKWVEVVEQMIDHGAPVSDADFDSVVDYLIAHYGTE